DRRVSGACHGGHCRLGGRVRQYGDHAVSDEGGRDPIPRDEFIAWLRSEGERRYHDRHRYHVLMHEGRLDRVQLQQWVLNRYYYQTRIPVKDALITSQSED